MNLHLTGHHVEITAAIREYVVSKLARINRHFDHVIDVNVIMTVEKLDQKIEANVHLSGKDIHVTAHDGESILGVLWANGHKVLRRSPVKGEPRGFLCGMGVCFECLVTVNARPNVRACLEAAKPDMVVETHGSV